GIVAVALAWQFGPRPQTRPGDDPAAAEIARLRADAEEAKKRVAAAEAKAAAESKARAATEAKAGAEAKAAAEAKRAQDEQRAAEARARRAAEAEQRKAAAAAARPAERTSRTDSAPRTVPLASGLAAAPEASSSLVAATAPAAAAAPRSFEGNWQAQLSCRPFAKRPGFTATLPTSVAGRTFTLQRGEPGGPESLQLTGTAGPDGRLRLAGSGFTGEPTRRQKSGQPFSAEFDGRFEGPRYESKGQLGAQDCTLVMTRAP
ncbi:MAG TPA: hypothetical protein VF876_11395, partial [Burkholderiales bacterium]